MLHINIKYGFGGIRVRYNVGKVDETYCTVGIRRSSWWSVAEGSRPPALQSGVVHTNLAFACATILEA